MLIQANKTTYHDRVSDTYTVVYYDPVTGARAWSGAEKKLRHAEQAALLEFSKQYEDCMVTTEQVEVDIESAKKMVTKAPPKIDPPPTTNSDDDAF